MSPQKNFNARGPQKGGVRMGSNAPSGFKGKFGGFQSKKSGPVQKFKPKAVQKEAFNDESDFDDSEASDFNDSSDEGDQKGARNGKRSLSFAKDVNTASAKKVPAQKTPMPAKALASNGKAQPRGLPVDENSKKPQSNKKSQKSKPIPFDDDGESEPSEFDSEMDEDDFDEMGSEEEEDSLMGVDEESSEDASEQSGSDERIVPQSKKKQEANGKNGNVKGNNHQLKVCGLPKSVAPEKLSSFFATKGFKNVQVKYDASAGCFIATAKSPADAILMKTNLKGAEFMKNKLSLLDHVQSEGKGKPTKPTKADKPQKGKQQELAEDEDQSDDDDDDDDDDEDLDDEEMDGLESFDEDDDDDEIDSEKDIMKKANQAAKSRVDAVKAAIDKKEPTTSAKTTRAVLTGIAKSYPTDKIKAFVESKGVKVKDAIAWEPQSGGFVVAVASKDDLDKVQALRGAKLEKFSVSVKIQDGNTPPKKAEPPTTPTSDSKKEKQAPASDGKLLAKEAKEDRNAVKSASKVMTKSSDLEDSTKVFKVALKGIPKSFSADKIAEYLQTKGVKVAGKIQWVQSASGFVVSTKSKADLDTVKGLKGEKIDKFRFAVADVSDSTALTKDTKKQSKNIKIADGSSEEDEEDESDESSLNLGKEGEDEDDDLSEEDFDEEASDDDEEELDVAPKKAKKTSPTEPSKKVGGKDLAFSFRLTGVPKVTPPQKLEEMFKQRNIPSISVKLQENSLIASVANTAEADKLRAMSGVRFNNFVIKIEDAATANSSPDAHAQNKSNDKTSAPSDQLQFRARLLSIPNDFAVSKLANLLKSRGVQSVVVTKENGQYIANCQTKIDYNRLLSMKGQQLENKLRLMVAPIHDDKQKQETRKRSADSTDENAVSSPEDVAAKKPRQDDSLQRRQLYIGDVPLSAKDESVKEAFPEAVAVKIIRRPGARKLFGFVTFDSEQTCELVKSTKDSTGGVKIAGERVKIDYCGDKSVKLKEIQADRQKVQAENPKAPAEKAQAKQSADKNRKEPLSKPEKSKPNAKSDSAAKAQPSALSSTSKKSTDQSKSQPASKSPSKVRFADDVAGSNDDEDDDDLSGEDVEMDDDSEGDDEEMSFDEDDDDDDEDDDEEDDDEDDE